MENLKVGDRVVSNYHGVNGQVVGIAEPLTIGDDTYPTIIVTHKAIFADFPKWGRPGEYAQTTTRTFLARDFFRVN